MKKMILFSVLMTTFLVCSSFSILGTEPAKADEFLKYGWIPEAVLIAGMALVALALFSVHFIAKRRNKKILEMRMN